MSTSKRRHNVSDDDSSDELGVLESEPDRKKRKYSKDHFEIVYILTLFAL